jgi:tryptophanyl-tRNA synthetase
VGLFAYPVLMAADILALDADEVPVGADQAQHLEIAADLAQQFARMYGPGILREPRALIDPAVATIPGLDGRKMSKSYENTIPLMAGAAETAALIRRIVTDSTPPGEPKAADTLVHLLRAFAEPATTAEIERRYETGGIGYGEVKARLAEAVEAHVGPLRARYEDLLEHPAAVHNRLTADEAHVTRDAEEVLARTMGAMGL